MEYTPGVCPLCTEVCPFQKLLAGQACSHALCPPCAEATRLCVPPVCTLCGADASGPWSPLATAADDDRCPPSPSLLTAARCAAETLSRVNRAAEAVALSLATPLPPPALQLQRTRYKALSAQAEEVQVAHGVLAGAVAAASAGLVVDLPRLHRLIAQALEQPDPVADSFVEVVPGTPDRLRMLRVDASKCSVRPRGVRSHNPAEAGPEPPTLLVHLRDDLGRPLADPGPQDLQVLLDGLEAEPVASGGEGEEGLLVFALPGTPGTWVHVEVRVRASAERTNVPVPGWQGRRLCTGAPFALARVREVGCVPPRVANCAASQDGRWLATTYHNNSMVHLFDLDADRLAVTVTLLSRAYGLAFCASVGRDEELGPSPSSLLLCIPSAGVLEEMGVFPSYDAPRRRAWLPGCASVAVLRNHLPRYAVASTFPSAPLLVLDHTWRVLKQVAVPLALSGVGTWGDKRKSHALWAGVRPSEPLMRLRNKIENALVRAGVEPDRRKFHPHVTLARTGASPAHRIGEFIAGHGAFATQSFAVNEFVLFSSFLSHSGAIYTPEASFPLGDHYERQSAWLENAEDMTDAI